ncbi:uncharacterized protein LOC109848329 [Asparagus officinalis]|uniref:uncharacterized protein LOC109848329 n=1 Tax=Asparagus officinalis TaxID=4686 RepID=UPI00098DF570|nr:uncharacterized protein LOC109848329 [Asparagus officinalis]
MAPKRRKSNDATTSNSRTALQHRSTRGNPSPPSNNPDGIIFDPDLNQEVRFNNLVSRRMTSTKFIDNDALLQLGLKENIYNLFNGIGWGEFVTLHRPTYRRLTLEFLSSLVVDANDSVAGGRLIFRFFNKCYVISMAKFNRLLSLPEQGLRKPPREWDPATFWRAITCEREGRANVRPYEPSKNKASQIYNPVFRYLQRLMANTIFGRGESVSVFRDTEVFLLYCLVNRMVVDVGYFLAKQLEKIGKSSVGDIVVGGMITILAERMNLSFTHLPIEKPISRLDLPYCTTFGLITKVEDEYWLTFFQGPIFPLPNHDLTNTESQENWQPPEGDLPYEPPPQVPLHQPAPYISPHDASTSSASLNWTNRFNMLERGQQHLKDSIHSLQQDMGTEFHAINARLDGFGTTLGTMNQLIQDLHHFSLPHDYAPPPPPQ